MKGILEHGWYWHNPNLGAPEGQQLFDFPVLSGDPLNVLLLKFLGLFRLGRGRPCVNVFFLLTFFLVGLSAYLVLRRLTVSWPGRDRRARCSTRSCRTTSTAARITCSCRRTTRCRSGRISCWRCSATSRCLRGALLEGRLLSYASRLTLGDAWPLRGDRRWRPGRSTTRRSRSCSSRFAALLRAVVGRSRAAAVRRRGGGRRDRSCSRWSRSLRRFVYRAHHGTNHRWRIASRSSRSSTGSSSPSSCCRSSSTGSGSSASLRQRYDAWSPADGGDARRAARAASATVGLLWLLAVSVLQLASPGRRVAPALRRAGGDGGDRRALLRLDRGLATLRRGGRAADSRLESPVDLHRHSSPCSRSGCCSTVGSAAARSRRRRGRAGGGRCSASSWRSGSSTRRAAHSMPPYRDDCGRLAKRRGVSCARSSAAARRARWSSSCRTWPFPETPPDGPDGRLRRACAAICTRTICAGATGSSRASRAIRARRWPPSRCADAVQRRRRGGLRGHLRRPLRLRGSTPRSSKELAAATRDPDRQRTPASPSSRSPAKPTCPASDAGHGHRGRGPRDCTSRWAVGHVRRLTPDRLEWLGAEDDDELRAVELARDDAVERADEATPRSAASRLPPGGGRGGT